MKLHDVTLVLRPDMPTWPGEHPPRVEPLRRIARGDGANVSVLTIGDHTGTHVDPPLHFIDGADGVDALPADALVGPCQVLGYEGDDHISQSWLEGAGVAPGIERIVFRTRNSARWIDPDAGFDKDFLALDETAARWLVQRGIRLVGSDYLSIEPFGSGKLGHPVHVALLRAGVVIVEGLDLHDVKPGPYEIVCAPLPIRGGTGSPARVFLIER